jgi:hypothetical protein
MYLRNAKQIFRAAGFDERRYGFGGLIELLRACQRDGLIRMERDRRGGLRVFQGPQLSIARASVPPRVESVDVAEEAIETPGVDGAASEDVPEVVAAPFEDTDEVIEIQPEAVIDTTAELLGRAKARRPRTRATTATQASGATAPRGARKGGAGKAGPRKTSVGSRRGGRAKKDVPDDIGNR